MKDEEFYEILRKFDDLSAYRLTTEQLFALEATANNAMLDAQQTLHMRGADREENK